MATSNVGIVRFSDFGDKICTICEETGILEEVKLGVTADLFGNGAVTVWSNGRVLHRWNGIDYEGKPLAARTNWDSYIELFAIFTPDSMGHLENCGYDDIDPDTNEEKRKYSCAKKGLAVIDWMNKYCTQQPINRTSSTSPEDD